MRSRKHGKNILGNLNARQLIPILKLQYNFTYPVTERENNPARALCIDSSSGAKVAPEDNKIIPEKKRSLILYDANFEDWLINNSSIPRQWV